MTLDTSNDIPTRIAADEPPSLIVRLRERRGVLTQKLIDRCLTPEEDRELAEIDQINDLYSDAVDPLPDLDELGTLQAVKSIAAMLRAESARYQKIDGTAAQDSPPWGWRIIAETLREMAERVERGEY